MISVFQMSLMLQDFPQRDLTHIYYKKDKAFHVTGRGGPKGYETLRLTHFLDNWLTDGGEGVSLMRRPPFTLRNITGPQF